MYQSTSISEIPIENAQMYSHMIFQYHLILIVS